MRCSCFWKFAAAAALMATGATPATTQGVNRRPDLISAPSGHADPGDLSMDINVTEALPNVFGAPGHFRTPSASGRVVIQYLGNQNGMAYFNRQSTAITSNETTMPRTPLFRIALRPSLTARSALRPSPGLLRLCN
jgi:hypothetical protein